MLKASPADYLYPSPILKMNNLKEMRCSSRLPIPLPIPKSFGSYKNVAPPYLYVGNFLSYLKGFW